jgi:hypothetical protein
MKSMKVIHNEKYDDPITSTFRGTSIELSDENLNAPDSV